MFYHMHLKYVFSFFVHFYRHRSSSAETSRPPEPAQKRDRRLASLVVVITSTSILAATARQNMCTAFYQALPAHKNRL